MACSGCGLLCSALACSTLFLDNKLNCSTGFVLFFYSILGFNFKTHHSTIRPEMDPAQINYWISRMENMLNQLVAASAAASAENQQGLAQVRQEMASITQSLGLSPVLLGASSSSPASASTAAPPPVPARSVSLMWEHLSVMMVILPPATRFSATAPSSLPCSRSPFPQRKPGWLIP